MREGVGYGLAALCLGWIAVWAGENLFWTTPAPDLRLVDLALTWAAYSVAAGAALSAVIWSGLGGWRAAFLGGALLGFQIEGAVVGTMYDALPAQLVWTPLAWHALISGLAVLGGGMALARGPVWRQVAGMVALGVFGAVWGLYWPLEGKVLAGMAGLAVYLGVTGAKAALGEMVALAGPRGDGGALDARWRAVARSGAAGLAGDGGGNGLGDGAVGAAGGRLWFRATVALGVLQRGCAGPGGHSAAGAAGLGSAGRGRSERACRAGDGGGGIGAVAVVGGGSSNEQDRLS
jgi:hypothetical protein